MIRTCHRLATRFVLGSVAALTLAGCAATPRVDSAPATPAPAVPAPYPSTYVAPAAVPVLIRGAVVLTGTGARLDNTDVLLANGRVSAVGPSLTAPAGARVIEARGKWVTPGLIPDSRRRSLAA